MTDCRITSQSETPVDVPPTTESLDLETTEAIGGLVACKAGELRKAAGRFGLDPSTTDDLAQTAIVGFLGWLRSRQEGFGDTTRVSAFLHKRLCWVRDSHWRRRARELRALESMSARESEGWRCSVVGYRRRETAIVLRVLVERRFENFYQEFAARYRPECVAALRELCGEKFPDDLFAQFFNARLIVFTEMAGDTRSTDDVAAIGQRLGLRLNAVQAALTRAQKPWLEVERVVFGASSQPNHMERRSYESQ